MKRSLLVLAALALLLCGVGQARADLTITITQQGADVVATGSGTIDTTDLTAPSAFRFEAAMNATSAAIIEGSTTAADMTQYSVTTNPSSFGTGGFHKASTGSGDQFGTDGATILVPAAYVSGHTLNATDTYANTTFSGLGLTPGTYTWTWGTGAHADSLTVQVGPATATPEPASLTLLGIGAVGLFGYGWRQRKRAAA